MKSTITLDSIVAKSQSQVSSELSGETVIMSTQSWNYFSLDPIASHIWLLLDQPQSVAQICQSLLAEYEVSPAQCEAEVIELLNGLLTDQLIDIHNHD